MKLTKKRPVLKKIYFYEFPTKGQMFFTEKLSVFLYKFGYSKHRVLCEKFKILSYISILVMLYSTFI